MISRDNYEEYTIDEIGKWNTPQLLSHFGNIRAYRQNALTLMEYKQEQLKEAEWSVKLYDNYISQLKEILSTREHIPNKEEAKVIRQQQAKDKKNR